MLSIPELKKVKSDLELLIQRVRALPESQAGLSKVELDHLAAQVPNYNALINDIEKGNLHDNDKELINSIALTKILIQQITYNIDKIQK
jgi:hypothetical protein